MGFIFDLIRVVFIVIRFIIRLLIPFRIFCLFLILFRLSFCLKELVYFKVRTLFFILFYPCWELFFSVYLFGSCFGYLTLLNWMTLLLVFTLIFGTVSSTFLPIYQIKEANYLNCTCQVPPIKSPSHDPSLSTFPDLASIITYLIPTK